MKTAATIVNKVRGAATSDGAGVKLTRIIGQPQLKNLDPFLMLDEFGSNNADDYIAGFPSHPHRGFQTVTYMLEGKMRHRDSEGNDGLIESGGIQWMNAGKGIIHEEMPEQTEGVMRGFQLWVNLPSSHKLSKPDYQDIPAREVPTIVIDESLKIKLLSGELENTTGPVTSIDGSIPTPFFADFSVLKEVTHTQYLNKSYQYFLYVYEGQLAIGIDYVKQGELVVLSKSDELEVVAQPDARWILVGGKPINEPIVQYGPFVMNTPDEIEQALKDYQNGVLTR